MYEELVKSIHCCFGFDSMQADCENCMMKDKREEYNYVGCCDALGLAATDAIEELQAYVALYKDGGETAMKVANDYKARIEELGNKLNLWRQDKISRWIPVTERLPEPFKNILVANKRGKHYDIDKGWWNGTFFDRCAKGGYHNVTHWMPLPKPPKEEA